MRTYLLGAILALSTFAVPASSWALRCDRMINEEDYTRIQMFEAEGQAACAGNPGKLLKACKEAGFECRDLQTDGHATCDFVIEGEKTFPRTAEGRKAILCDRFYECGEQAMRTEIDGIDGFVRFQEMADAEGCQVVAHGARVNNSEITPERQLRDDADASGNTRALER